MRIEPEMCPALAKLGSVGKAIHKTMVAYKHDYFGYAAMGLADMERITAAKASAYLDGCTVALNLSAPDVYSYYMSNVRGVST